MRAGVRVCGRACARRALVFEQRIQRMFKPAARSITSVVAGAVGEKGETIEEGPIPDDLADLVEEKRALLIERLADVDDEIAELFLMEETPSVDELK